MPKKLQVDLTAIYTGHADAIYDICPGKVLPYFYSASADQFIGCWNKATGTFEQPLAKATSPVYCMEPVEGGALLLIGTRSGLIHVVDIQTKKPLHSLQLHTKPVFDLQVLPGLHLFAAVSEDGYMSVWDTRTFQLVHHFYLTNTSLRCAALSPDGQSLAVGGSDNLIRIFSLPAFEQVAVLEGHDNSVFSCIFSDNETMLSGSRDAHLIQWKKEGDKWQVNARIPAHHFTINHIAISPGKKYIATASRDKTVKIWDAHTLDLLKVLDREKYESAHTHSVNRLLWLSDTGLLSAGDDKRIIAWQMTSPE